MPPKTAGTYRVEFKETRFSRTIQDENEVINRTIYLYASSPASARQIVGKRFGLTEADIVGAELITDTNE